MFTSAFFEIFLNLKPAVIKKTLVEHIFHHKSTEIDANQQKSDVCIA